MSVAGLGPCQSPPDLPLAQAYHPTTFLERGVAVPFTTPALQGARARPAERGGLEIIVPNPSGGRGVYILPWTGVCQLCRPTAHDTLLSERIAALRRVTPAAMRQAAGAIAAEGLAGRMAQAAAGTVAKGDREDRLLTNFRLLLALTEQVVPAEFGGLSLERVSPRELEQHAQTAVAHIGPKLGRDRNAVAEGLEQPAEAFTGIGAPGQKPAPRTVRLLEAVSRLRADLRGWGKEHVDDSAAQAEMIGVVADLTIVCAQRTLADAHALIANMPGLLRSWASAPDPMRAAVARPEWLLDGWEQICLVWNHADGEAGRRIALSEMALLVPVLPRETSDWVGTQIDTDLTSRLRRIVRQHEDWRTGLTVARVARNEALRALAI
jgi:hypothetical protein